MRGAFGRLPMGGSGTNLTSMIKSLRDSQQAAADKAIFDAYQNGGMYQGKPVTDAIMVAYITSRQNQYTKDDPLYSQWGDTLFQTKFNIGEQSIQLAYKQGKASAGAVAAFYNQQLRSIPKDSAFGRTVMDHAATWAKAAGSAARAGGKAAVNSAMDAKLAPQFNAIAKYDAVSGAIKDIAVRMGLLTDTQSLTDIKDAGALESLINGLKGNASFTKFVGQPMSFAVYQQLADNKFTAMNTQIVKYAAAGRAVKSLETKRAAFVTELHQTNALTPRAAYEAANGAFAADMARIGPGDPQGQAARVKDYIAQLQGIANKAGNATGINMVDPNFIGGINNEINVLATGKVSGPTVADMFNGSKSGGSGSAYADSLAVRIGGNGSGTLGLIPTLDGIANHTGYMGQTNTGGPITFQAYPAGSQVLNDPNHGLPPNTAPQWVHSNDGTLQQVMMVGQAINAMFYYGTGGTAAQNAVAKPLDPMLPADAAKIAAGLRDGSLVAGAATVPTTLGYQYVDAHGTLSWGVVNPTTGVVSFTNVDPFNHLQPLGSKGDTGALYVATVPDAQGNAPVPGSAISPETARTMQLGSSGAAMFVSRDVTPQDLLNQVAIGVIRDPAQIQAVDTMIRQNQVVGWAGQSPSYQAGLQDQALITGAPAPDHFQGNGPNSNIPQIKLPNLGAMGANGSYGANAGAGAFQTPSGSPPTLNTPGLPGMSGPGTSATYASQGQPPAPTSSYQPPTPKSAYVAPPDVVGIKQPSADQTPTAPIAPPTYTGQGSGSGGMKEV